MAYMVWDALSAVTDLIPITVDIKKPAPKKLCSSAVVHNNNSLSDMNFSVRIAGISGALAVGFGAYGSHALRTDETIGERRRLAFETGNRYHMIHSLALLGSSKARFPLLTASLFAGGIVMFSFPCYHYGLTGSEQVRKYTPIGGIIFILGWLSFVL